MITLPRKRRPIPDDEHVLKRDDILKFVELDLWARFQTRLWTLLGVFLTLISVAGYLGVPYYIETEIERRFADQKQAFERRASEVMTHAQLLQILSLRRTERRVAFEHRLGSLLRSLDEYAAKRDARERENFWPIDRLKHELALIQYRSSYESSLENTQRLASMITKELAAAEVMPSEMVVQEIRTATGSTMGAHTHPVLDGSISGAITDLRFRMIELQAYDNAITHIQTAFSELGGATPLAKRQQAVAVSALAKELLYPKYATERQVLSQKHLSKEEIEKYGRLQSMYGIAETEHP